MVPLYHFGHGVTTLSQAAGQPESVAEMFSGPRRIVIRLTSEVLVIEVYDLGILGAARSIEATS